LTWEAGAFRNGFPSWSLGTSEWMYFHSKPEEKVRIAIVGSRRFKNRKKVIDLVNSLPQETVIVTGGCRGPDTWAENAAKKRGLKTIIFLPKLPPDNSPRHEFIKAYYERNLKIAQNADMVHAFVSSDRKGGTENTIKHAEMENIPIVIHYE
jgi:hypothetical protein